ncbi:MAG TPA: hypothetical protein VM925_05200 [Labilithrix sp.]|nr:hypothetical protein [Labilithrix sp.]
MNVQHVVVFVLVGMISCGGETLNVGYDDTRLGQNVQEPVDLVAVGNRCAASFGESALLQGWSPQQNLDAVETIIVGRWLACQGSEPTTLPRSLEFTTQPALAYVLHEPKADRVFVRSGDGEPYSTQWSVRHSSVELLFRGERLRISFERNPMRMTVVANGVVWRFVKV